MAELREPAGSQTTHPWLLILGLVGVDYFSTLAYLPSIAIDAAGSLAPVAAGTVVLVTFLLALPVYWYVVGRSPDGRGATGLLEDDIPGWRGKLAVLTLLGFAAADFVITRSLSLADAAVHLIHNPHGQRLLERLPSELSIDDHWLWPPLEELVRRLIDPQVAITLILSLVSFVAWQIIKRGLGRGALYVTAAAVGIYLLLTGWVIGSAVGYLNEHVDLWHQWREAALASTGSGEQQTAHEWIWAWLGIALWSFPQMVLGLSGFEMIMTLVPRVSAGKSSQQQSNSIAHHAPVARVRNARKLMLVAAVIMAVYMTSAVTVTTLLVPRGALLAGGAAEHRALAYLAHGEPLIASGAEEAVDPLFGHAFGDVYDLATALVLCLAGASVTMGLQSLLPHYLHRLGMEISWAGKVGVILYLLNIIVLVVTIVFRASPSSQQWAYASSVLVLLAGASLAAAKDLSIFGTGWGRALRMAGAALAAGFFLTMTLLTTLINHSGLTIALLFVAAILISSIVSRWIRSTELRFEGFEFVDEATQMRWEELRRSGAKVLAPHRPGLVSLADKSRVLAHDYRIDPATPLIFIEATLGDPSNFYQQPKMKIEREGGLEVIRVSHCVSVAHVLAAICLELCRDGGVPPEIIFGWSAEPPLAANLNFLLLGEGNIPWMVKELVRKATPEAARQPRILIG